MFLFSSEHARPRSRHPAPSQFRWHAPWWAWASLPASRRAPATAVVGNQETTARRQSEWFFSIFLMTRRNAEQKVKNEQDPRLQFLLQSQSVEKTEFCNAVARRKTSLAQCLLP